jgi:methyl-accepting chemotaxis protein
MSEEKDYLEQRMKEIQDRYDNDPEYRAEIDTKVAYDKMMSNLNFNSNCKEYDRYFEHYFNPIFEEQKKHNNFAVEYFEYLGNQQEALANQVSQLLIQQQSFSEQIVQAINLQSQAINELMSKVQTLTYKLADMEIKENTIEDSLRDVEQSVQNVNEGLENVSRAVSNIKVYQMVEQNW